VVDDNADRTVLVLDLMANTTELERKLFTYSPEDPGEFVVGSPAFWKDDPKYNQLVDKGAFEAWKMYDLALTGEPKIF
jgi:hypothetical protein